MLVRGRFLVGAILLVLSALVGAACSVGAKSAYPQKPVSLIVPFAAGGGVDTTARALAEGAKAYFPQPITVVNKPGGGGTVGVAEAVQSPPDGYTAAISGASLLIQPHITDLPYKGPEDYRPLIKAVIAPEVFAVRSDAPWKTMREFLDYAKSNPGKVRVNSSGYGSAPGICLETLKDKAGIDLIHVPTSGASEQITALLGGNAEASVITAGEASGQAQAGKVRVLATFEEKRVPLYPDAPTLKEVLGSDVAPGVNFYVVILPKGTPDPVAQTLHDAFKKAMETEGFKKFAQEQGYVIDYKGLEDLKKDMAERNTALATMVKKLEKLIKQK